MFAKKIAKTLIILNALGWAVNSLLHYARIYEPKVFGLSIQITVALFLGVAIYFYKNPTSTAWFGTKLDPSSEVSQTLSFVASCVSVLPVLMFNLYPLSIRFGS